MSPSEKDSIIFNIFIFPKLKENTGKHFKKAKKMLCIPPTVTRYERKKNNRQSSYARGDGVSSAHL